MFLLSAMKGDRLIPNGLNIIADEQIVDAERFSRFGNIHYLPGREITYSDLSTADVLLVRSVTKVNKDLLENTPVKFVGTATSGIDHIDTNYLAENNIQFAAAYGCNAKSVVEYVLSSIHALFENQEISLQDKTVGIVGVGNVGRLLKSVLNAMQVKTLCNDPPLQSQGMHGLVSLDEVCAEADIISLHVPLARSGEYATWRLFDATRLDSLKQDVVLINTARGGVVDESALAAFKASNTTAKLIFDVWEDEPEISLQTVAQANIATPHIAGYSYDGKLKATEILSRALSQWLSEDINQELAFKQGEVLQGIFLSSNKPIEQAIFSGYDVRIDHTSLMPVLREPPKSRANYFDMLRRTYPKRREFNTIEITSKHEPQVVKVLDSLGFQIAKVYTQIT